jgi:hypothetical protein
MFIVSSGGSSEAVELEPLHFATETLEMIAMGEI